MSLAQIGDLPRHPIYDEAAGLTTLLRVRLGEKRTSDRTGNEYPVETDHFVLLAEDGATDDVLNTYQGRPKVLYCMLAAEAPWPGRPEVDGSRSLLIHNMNYGTSGLFCQGTGGSAAQPGQAICYHEPLAHNIAKAIGDTPQRRDDGTHVIVCRGRDCPQFKLDEFVRKQEQSGKIKMVPQPAPLAGAVGDAKRAPNAGCKLIGRFKAFLLHPDYWESDPAGHVLAVMEIVSGSIHTITALRDDLHNLRAYTRHPHSPEGRTAFIPFALTRRPKTTMKGGQSKHWPLAIKPTPTVWRRWSQVRPELMFTDPAVVAAIQERFQAEAVLALASVKDIIPRPAELAATEETDRAALEQQVHGGRRQPVPQGVTTVQADEAVEAAARPAPSEEDLELDQQVGKAEIRELKRLLGRGIEGGAFGDPQNPDLTTKPEVTERLRQKMRDYRAAHGLPPAGQRISEMTVRVYRWIRDSLPPEPDEDDLVPAMASGEAVQEEML